ncbi:GDSL esterase/lipase 5-like isoform X2 [Cucumis melo var. makuwa]|uniref:GDSL esterase/lipase 5-like isoform X2 n=1 Tax=Cucumis melo var. makuwa TaxID=1194695 RepID=A0A5A7T2U9_CUCMM|nr:GDSL esterase/lipase 5-like isoform X2 [Cucumis melo var. makuwa]
MFLHQKIAFFIFGDSFSYPRNNNFINTTEDFHANFMPYGESFFKTPTKVGRRRVTVGVTNLRQWRELELPMCGGGSYGL